MAEFALITILTVLVIGVLAYLYADIRLRHMSIPREQKERIFKIKKPTARILHSMTIPEQKESERVDK